MTNPLTPTTEAETRTLLAEANKYLAALSPEETRLIKDAAREWANVTYRDDDGIDVRDVLACVEKLQSRERSYANLASFDANEPDASSQLEALCTLLEELRASITSGNTPLPSDRTSSRSPRG